MCTCDTAAKAETKTTCTPRNLAKAQKFWRESTRLAPNREPRALTHLDWREVEGRLCSWRDSAVLEFSVAASLCLSRVLTGEHFQQVVCSRRFSLFFSFFSLPVFFFPSYVQRAIATARCDAGWDGRCAALVGACVRAAVQQMF